MSNLARVTRQTFTIARRDFVATVFTPTFLLFLLAPLLMIAFGTVGGIGAASISKGGGDKLRLVIVAEGDRARALAAADARLRRIYRERERPPPLVTERAGPDAARQARAMFDAKDREVSAVLYGPLEKPQILYSPSGGRSADYLAELAEQVLRVEKTGAVTALSEPTRVAVARTGVSAGGQTQAAFFAVFGLFMVSLMLAGQAVGTMAEERSNKVIEILAAAVPLESVLFGKLLGMFGVALLFLTFWGTVVFNVGALLPVQVSGRLDELVPAVGLPMFVLLFFGYFVMAYMLLGAVFLGIGAQASTQRELQMLSLPITIFQVAMFGFASGAAASPDSWVATAAELFPFSSPFAMAARAANSPELWRHGLALAWQALWVVITVSIAARLFRRGVLQSGSPKLRLRKRPAEPAIDNTVS
ncbi:ABC transporter permease [Sphingomonas sp. MG17]|uniref:ABC transporter permease n=1 Tax=Sphingomonas tagetis TaxID=2949092 RepID=A0A9X2HJS6_9SPHN|nr:ABC transporter permease [Sphingomonas tagetis]MCP3730957.1 ABC transporter permease [Sphingomonas tagetis]